MKTVYRPILDAIFCGFILSTLPAAASEVAITIDDAELIDVPLMSPLQKDLKILETLKSENVTAALFVTGKRIDNEGGRALLKRWSQAGHLLGNHTYSHQYFHAKSLTLDAFIADTKRAETHISGLRGFKKFFRFPMLKEGNTIEKRDGMRAFLKETGYRHGYVTIDTSEWYICDRLTERLRANPNLDLKPFRDFYLKHIWDRSVYYDTLAKKIFGREIKHTLLIHHNLVTALFLKDLLAMYKEKGWKIISPESAYADPVFSLAPMNLPAGEGIVWAAAKESGKFETLLRYPAEDSVYETAEMDRLGL